MNPDEFLFVVFFCLMNAYKMQPLMLSICRGQCRCRVGLGQVMKHLTQCTLPYLIQLLCVDCVLKHNVVST